MPCAAKIEEILLRSTYDGLFGADIVTSLAVNLGMVLLVPMAAEMAKPIAKLTIKTGITAYEKGKDTLRDAVEAVEDLIAEAKSEL
ncbi:MAG: DUF5132 domain-containing protein [Nitrospirota bacterium]